MAKRGSVTVRERLLSAGGPALLSVLVLGLVGLLIFAARRDAARAARFHVDPAAVTIAGRPDWMPDALAAQLAGSLGADLGAPVSLLDDEALRSWERDLPQLSAWVERVDQVEPLFPARAEVRLRVRRPVLVLPGNLLVAADGQRLGHGTIEAEPVPLAYLGPSDPDDIDECAAAAGELLPFREELADRGVTVTSVRTGELGRVVFGTDGGPELEWGRSGARSEFSAVDLPAASRVANLMTLLARRPGLHGVRLVVLWKDRPDVVMGS